MSPTLASELKKLKRALPLLGVFLVLLMLYGLGSFAAGIALGPQERWKKQMARPARFGLSPETVRFTSADGIPIQAWYERTWTSDAPRGTLLLVHGPRGNKSSMVGLGGMALRRGYNVLIPDLRGHGDSGGTYATFGYREAADIVAALDWARVHANQPLAVLGYSSGAVAALHAAAQSPQMAAVVADSPYSSISNILARESDFLGQSALARQLPWSDRLRLWLFTHPGTGTLGHWVFRMRAGVAFDPPEADLLSAVRKIRQPAVLYLAADADPVVPASEMRQIFEATASPNKQLVFQPGKFHSAFAGDPRRYVKIVTEFLDRSLAASR